MDIFLSTALKGRLGLATRSELESSGVRPRAIDAAVSAGSLLRVRRGVYASPALPIDVVRAARVGGVLAGPSALPVLGLWTPPDRSVLHVSVGPHARGLRSPDDPTRPLDRRDQQVKVLYDGHQLTARDHPHVGVASGVRQSVALLEPRLGLAVLDSALRCSEMGREGLEFLRSALPARCHAVVDRRDARAESGTESVLRWGLIEAGLAFEPQVKYPGLRVDFVVENRVVVECVSYEHHASPAEYARDRERITALVRRGLIVLEFTYHQVLFAWPSVLAAIVSAVIRG